MTDNIFILIILSVIGIALFVGGVILLQMKSRNSLLLKEQQMAAAEIAHQKDLLHAIITSQEAERKRIGTDLHDEVGSVLSSLRILIERHNELNISGTDIASSGKDIFSAQSKILIDRVIKSVRQISHDLSPRISGQFGLYDALHELCDAVVTSGAIRVNLDFNEEDSPVSLNPGAAVLIYRLLAELINNTIKHADAKQIDICIRSSGDQMQLEYRDDGIGFMPHHTMIKKGMGLQNIESRLTILQARSEWKTGAGKGFHIVINIPLE